MQYRLIMWAALLCIIPKATQAQEPKQLWLYYPTNLLVDENVDRLEGIWKRAALAGYTHVLLADSKFTRLGEMDGRYFKNIARVKKIAADDKLTIVPALFPIGYSNDLLFHDPNLAEGLPVRDALFVVKNGEARVQADPPVSLAKVQFKDDAIAIGDDGAATVNPTEGNARLVFAVPVSPYRCYHVSARVKTHEYSGTPEIKVLGNDRSLTFSNLHVQRTQDWTEHHVVFNSAECKTVNVYLGVWGGGKGELAWRDWKIEEAGPVNLLRRPGAPLVVRDDVTGKPLSEGKDFEPLADPLMGSQPWPGEFTIWHKPPVIKTSLPDGARLRVSWFHPALIYDGQVCACPSEPKTMELLADQAHRMKSAWGAGGYMMSHDEIRVLNQDDACQRRKQSPGQLLADNVRQCRELLENSTAYVWSDMFDPFHNAVKGPYYLVNGDLTGAWEGLGRDVAVMNWNFDHRDESLKFFADRGHRQIIAGYYDNDLKDMRKWLESSAKVKGVAGYMYTTWASNYEQMEAFAKLCRPSETDAAR